MFTLPTHIPPGVTFLSSIAPDIFASAALVVFTNRYAPFRISNTTWVAFFVGLVPIYSITKSTIRYFKRVRESKRMGARMPPFNQHTVLTMGIDIILRVTRNSSKGYLGIIALPIQRRPFKSYFSLPADAFPNWDKTLGHTFAFDIFGDYVVSL